MGNLYEKTYIVGEVDYQVVALDRPLLYPANICLRYPSYFTIEPVFKINYNQPLHQDWLFVSNRDAISFDRPIGKTRIVMIECNRNIITGYFSDCKIIKHDLITK
jgi:hypothetical protein